MGAGPQGWPESRLQSRWRPPAWHRAPRAAGSSAALREGCLPCAGPARPAVALLQKDELRFAQN